ncbi:hypothetical protein [Profundibacter sp.]
MAVDLHSCLTTHFKNIFITRLECVNYASCAGQIFWNFHMVCNAYNHPLGCDCGFGGDTGGDAFGTRFWDSGNVPLPQSALQQVVFNTTCPSCGELCYYYENEFGSKVWFDELGAPWTKHPCFDGRQPDLYPIRPNEAFNALHGLEPTARQLFSKKLWQKGCWHFFSVLTEKHNAPRFPPWGRRDIICIDVGDHERAIGCFVTRHPIRNGLFSFISWTDGTFFAIPNDAAEMFQIFPIIWKNRVFDRVSHLQLQWETECFHTVIEGAWSISDAQDRIHLANLLYDQTDLPIDTIAFLARVSLNEAIKVSNGDAKPTYVKNFAKVQRVATEISDRLYEKPQRS